MSYAVCVVAVWHREGPHLVVSVLGSCYSRHGPPTSSTNAMSYAVCVVAVMAQSGPPPRCFGSG